MIRYAVVGASLMGRVIAKELLRGEEHARVTLFDVDAGLLEEARTSLMRDKALASRLATAPMDVRDAEGAAQALAGHDAAVGALPHAVALQALNGAVRAGVSMVDLVGSKAELRRELDGEARDAGVLLIPGMGVAPGLSNVLVARGTELLDEAHEAVIYVGGIPVERTPPLEYQTVYSLVSMFGVYLRPVRVWRDGAWTTVEPLSGRESLDFPEPVGSLEALYTDGLGSLTVTQTGQVRDRLEEKTLRYPGFAEKVEFLKDCGLLDAEPVRVGNVDVAPRDVLIRQLAPRLKLGPQGDILAMRVVVKGLAGGRETTHAFELVDFMDPDSGETAMARTTGYPAAITARMLAGGGVAERGVRFPEEFFLGVRGDHLLAELGARGVVVQHEVS